MKRLTSRCAGLIIALVTLHGLTGCSTYNRLVALEQNVNKKWADVQSVYQRRADLIPNLVSTVQGAANFEKSTLTEVTNARASVGRVQLDPNKAPTDAKQLEEFQQAQGQLSNALSRLLVVSENYPQLRATQGFQDLQAQLEGTENRISVERNNFNSAVQQYNTALSTFPTNMLNKMFGFQPKPFFTAQAGAEKAPPVQFNFGPAPTPAANLNQGPAPTPATATSP
jgi:LemA protein